MGWLRTILLGDIGNRLDIEDSEQEIERLKVPPVGPIESAWQTKTNWNRSSPRMRN